jgi:hypothetical protein
LTYARLPKENREHKMVPTSIQTIFIGYQASDKQYKIYEPRKGIIIIIIQPDFHKDKQLQWNWGNDTSTADLVLP